MRSPFSYQFPTTDVDLAARVTQFPAFSTSSIGTALAYLRERGRTVLATPSLARVAEQLQGAAQITASGQYLWTQAAWGGAVQLRTDRGLSTINWAVSSAGTVLGTVQISFLGVVCDENLAEISARPVVRPRDITYPVLADRRYNLVQVRARSVSGTERVGLAGWNFSSAQLAGIGGAYSGTWFSADDGAWAVRIGAAVDGDTPGGTVQAGTQSFGITNYDASEPVAAGWWDGTSYPDVCMIVWT